MKGFVSCVTGLAAAIAAVLGVSGDAAAAGRSDLVQAALAAGKAHIADEMLVQFKPGASAADKARALGRVGAEQDEILARGRERIDAKGDLVLVRLPVGQRIANALRGVEADAAVEFAEPNWVVQHAAVSNDPLFTNGSLWGMAGDNGSPANAFGSRAAEAWAKGQEGCGSVVIGIIDEGYMYTHEDLAGNAFTNPGEIANNGADDDGNGYVDDVYGWDFDGGNNTVFDSANDDHGTHVAGTIGAVGGNGKGVAGVCWDVQLMGAKFLGRRGGTTANAIKAVDYFTDLKLRHDLNIVATNNSWGGGGYSQGLYDAIERANQAGILFVAAAGNDAANNDATPHYPSSYTNANIIAVASITSTGGLSSFSSYGATSVDIGAPGSAIQSTVPKSSKGQIVSAYAAYSGTSMATPHVAGAVALYAAVNALQPATAADAAAIKGAILAAGTPTPSLAGKTVTGDRLNVESF